MKEVSDIAEPLEIINEEGTFKISIDLTPNETIKFEVIQKDHFNYSRTFVKEYSLEGMKKASPYFKQCKTLKIIQDDLRKKIPKKECTITINNNELILSFDSHLIVEKYKYAHVPVYEKKSNVDTRIKEISEIEDIIMNKIDSLRNSLKDQTFKLEQVKQENAQLANEITHLEEDHNLLSLENHLLQKVANLQLPEKDLEKILFLLAQTKLEEKNNHGRNE